MHKLLLLGLLAFGTLLATNARADNWTGDPTLNGTNLEYENYADCMNKSPDRTKCSQYPDAPTNLVPTATDNQIGMTLSQQMYCQSKSVLAGNLGLIVGLLMAISGLWAMVNGSLTGGLITLIAGALITALPSLTESFLSGLGTVLQNNGIGTQGFRPPGC